jgi:hypothetical protein
MPETKLVPVLCSVLLVPTQVDLPDEEYEDNGVKKTRPRESIHLRPGATVERAQEHWDLALKARPELAPQLRFLVAAEPPKVEPPKVEPPKVEPPKVEDTSDETTDKKPTAKRPH